MHRRFVSAAVLASMALLAWPVAAQNYPSKPIKIVVPFPAGGTSDVLARLIGQKMTESWGQPVVVRTSPDRVATSAPMRWPSPHPMATRSC